jgi:predicted transport protein
LGKEATHEEGISMTDPRTIMGPMADSLEATTGRSVEDWLVIVRGLGLQRHGEILAALKRDHGLSHGYANLLALVATGYGQQGEAELVEGLFVGPKAGLRPLYDRILEIATGLGDDVAIAPKKTMVSFRRKKQFACFTPMSAKRVDLGVNLRGDLADEAVGVARLRPTPGGMASHVFAITTPEEVDDEVMAWIRRAYDAN